MLLYSSKNQRTSPRRMAYYRQVFLWCNSFLANSQVALSLLFWNLNSWTNNKLNESYSFFEGLASFHVIVPCLSGGSLVGFDISMNLCFPFSSVSLVSYCLVKIMKLFENSDILSLWNLINIMKSIQTYEILSIVNLGFSIERWSLFGFWYLITLDTSNSTNAVSLTPVK